MFHQASSAHHWRKAGNRSALERVLLVSLIELSTPQGFVPLGDNFHCDQCRICIYKYRTIASD